MNNNWLISQTVDLQKGIQAPRMWPNALMTTQDENAHTWEITILDGGEPANITGTVTGKFLRCDNETVLIGGTLAGNVASVTLERGCYVLPSGKNHGTLSGIMNVTTASGTMTIGALVFSVQNLTSDVIVDPGRVIPSLAELIDKIEACEDATTDALNAASAAQVYTTKENLFSLTNSAVGWLTATGELAAPGAETRERTSEMIPVTPDNQMTCQVWVNVPTGAVPWVAYAFYNASFALMGSLVTTTEATSTAADGSQYVAMNFTVPTGAAYMRMSFRTFGDARAKLEVSSATTPYVINKVDYLEQQNAAVNKAGRLIDTATGNPVEIHTDETIRMPLLGVAEAGATSQNGTPTPSSPVSIEGLAGYDTMTVSGGVYTYSRSAAFDASADQYYAVQVEDGSGNTTWIGTTEKIAPLYEGDSIDFTAGIVTRTNLLTAHSNDDIRSTGSSSAGLRYFSAAAPGGIALAQTTESNPYPKCDRAVSSPTASVVNSIRATQDGATVYYVYGTSDDTDATLREKFGGAKILLRRKNQVTETVPMSSDLSGINGYLTLTGSGTLTVRYAADLKTYIDNAIANALNA